ncbi:MAG: hypothetical protein LBG45_07165 [Dysgonamonadaceae bacterium]|nr:hypothetical protein [Dysgonamonadaceae bacterium]
MDKVYFSDNALPCPIDYESKIRIFPITVDCYFIVSMLQRYDILCDLCNGTTYSEGANKLTGNLKKKN